MANGRDRSHAEYTSCELCIYLTTFLYEYSLSLLQSELMVIIRMYTIAALLNKVIFR